MLVAVAAAVLAVAGAAVTVAARAALAAAACRRAGAVRPAGPGRLIAGQLAGQRVIYSYPGLDPAGLPCSS